MWVATKVDMKDCERVDSKEYKKVISKVDSKVDWKECEKAVEKAVEKVVEELPIFVKESLSSS